MFKAHFINIKRLLIYLTTICFVLDIGTVYTHVQNPLHLSGLAAYLPIILLILIVAIGRTYESSKVYKAVSLSAILMIYFTLYAFVSGSLLRVTIPQIALVVCLVFYFILEESGGSVQLLIAYRNLITIIAVVSLFFWLFGCILHFISPNSTVVCYWGTAQTLKSYYMLHFEREQTYIFGTWITANRSIFTERAFASFAFSIGFLYELLIEEKKSKFRLITLASAMASTSSMTGLIIMIITIMLYYIFNGTNRKIISFLRIIFIPFVVGVSYFSIRYLLDVKFSMGMSATSRMQSFINGFKAWLQSPLWGFGYGNGDEILQNFSTGSSNSISMVLTRGGIMIAWFYVYSIAKGIVSGIKAKNINRTLFLIIIVIEFTFTAIAFISEMIYLLLVFTYVIGSYQRKVNVTEDCL